jgi:hypothetical protein
MDGRSTFALIGERYLDTQHSIDGIARLEEELARRGVTGPTRWLYEYLAASSLWWNLFWWEWVSLDGRAVVAGWVGNVVVFGGLAAVAGVAWGAYVGLVILLGLHLVTMLIGFDLRAGTKASG